MTKIKIINNEIIKYPYTQSDFVIEYPNISFNQDWWNSSQTEYYNIYNVVIDVDPSYNSETEKIITNDPLLINNIWTVTKEVVELTLEELEVIAKAANPAPETVKGADLRAILKTFKVANNTLVNIDNKDDISLYSQIETALQNGVNIGVLSMICALEQFQTLAEFNRNSKGITDMIAYLPFMTDEIADEAFRKTSTINQ